MTWPETITTPRLVLRRPRPTDADSLFAEYTQDPEVTRYLVWKPHKDRRETAEYLARCEQGWISGSEMTWAMTFPSDDRAIGMFALRPHGHKPDLGYVLSRRFWGQGLMAEAGKAVVDLAMQQEGVFRVWAVCDVDNAQSARVLEKMGMQREGVLRRWMVHGNVSTEPRDALVYAKVRG